MTPAVCREDMAIPGAHWSVSPAKIASFMLSERPCLLGRRGRRKTPLGSVCTHTHMLGTNPCETKLSKSYLQLCLFLPILASSLIGPQIPAPPISRGLLSPLQEQNHYNHLPFALIPLLKTPDLSMAPHCSRTQTVPSSTVYKGP